MSDKNVSSENTCFQKYVKECWELIIRYYKEQDYTTERTETATEATVAVATQEEYPFTDRATCSIILELEDLYYFCVNYQRQSLSGTSTIIELSKFIDTDDDYQKPVKLAALSDIEIVRVAHFIHLLNENISELENIINTFELHEDDGVFTYGELYPCSCFSYYNSIKDNSIMPVSYENPCDCGGDDNRCDNPIFLASINFSELFNFIDYNNINNFTINTSEWVDLPLYTINGNDLSSLLRGRFDTVFINF